VIGVRQALPALLSAALWSAAAAQEPATPGGGLAIRDAWVRESTATRTISSGYLRIENRTARPVALVKVSLQGVGDAQLHAIVEQNGQSTMRPLTAIPIPAHGAVDLAPGGAHVMLMDIARPLRIGSSVEMTLTFDNKQTRRVRALVRPLGAMTAR
jgi:copper(I)-binding protein